MKKAFFYFFIVLSILTICTNKTYSAKLQNWDLKSWKPNTNNPIINNKIWEFTPEEQTELEELEALEALEELEQDIFEKWLFKIMTPYSRLSSIKSAIIDTLPISYSTQYKTPRKTIKKLYTLLEKITDNINNQLQINSYSFYEKSKVDFIYPTSIRKLSNLLKNQLNYDPSDFYQEFRKTLINIYTKISQCLSNLTITISNAQEELQIVQTEKTLTQLKLDEQELETFFDTLTTKPLTVTEEDQLLYEKEQKNKIQTLMLKGKKKNPTIDRIKSQD